MVSSVDELIKALGGGVATAAAAGVGKSAVSNWKASGRIPAEQFLNLSAALAKVGKQPDPAMFGFTEPAEVRA